MIKAVFFDFDDTLVSKKTNKMIESTRKALELLHLKNIIPIMATGRPMYTIKKYIVNNKKHGPDNKDLTHVFYYFIN